MRNALLVIIVLFSVSCNNQSFSDFLDGASRITDNYVAISTDNTNYSIAYSSADANDSGPRGIGRSVVSYSIVNEKIFVLQKPFRNMTSNNQEDKPTDECGYYIIDTSNDTRAVVSENEWLDLLKEELLIDENDLAFKRLSKNEIFDFCYNKAISGIEKLLSDT